LGGVDVTVGERAVVELIVVPETQCGVRYAVLETVLGEILGERSENLITDIVTSRVGKCNRLDGKTSSSHKVNDGRTMINHGRQKLMELGKSSIISILIRSST
jgi:hypothetical protein